MKEKTRIPVLRNQQWVNETKWWYDGISEYRQILQPEYHFQCLTKIHINDK